MAARPGGPTSESGLPALSRWRRWLLDRYREVASAGGRLVPVYLFPPVESAPGHQDSGTDRVACGNTARKRACLKLISKMPGLQKLGQVLARNRRLSPALRQALSELENGMSDVMPGEIRAIVDGAIGTAPRSSTPWNSMPRSSRKAAPAPSCDSPGRTGRGSRARRFQGSETLRPGLLLART